MIISDAEGDVIRSFDGTLLATRRGGEGDGLPVLISNGVGANLAPWRKVLVDVERGHTVVSWDLRGLLGSGPPASPRMDPGAHAEDAVAVVDHHGLEEFAIVAWSNGSRIALEIADRYPERVRGLVLVCGAYGQPLGRAVRNLEPQALLPSIAGVAKHFGAALQAPLRAFVGRPEIAGIIMQTGMVGASADTKLLVELLEGIASCDMRMFLATFEAIAGDSAPELVADIGVPVLLVAGDRDRFVPLRMMEEMHEMIPNSTLEVYEGASHYLPIEYPARLSDDLRRFLKELE